jgi:hypothetical protein
MMVAVALGLLGPGALESVVDLEEGPVAAREIDEDTREHARQLWLEAREAFDAERDQ